MENFFPPKYIIRISKGIFSTGNKVDDALFDGWRVAGEREGLQAHIRGKGKRQTCRRVFHDDDIWIKTRAARLKVL